MTLDFNHYRAAGDKNHYTDAEILRLWGFVDHLATRAIAQACPHLIAPGRAPNAALAEGFALYSRGTSHKEKEAKT